MCNLTIKFDYLRKARKEYLPELFEEFFQFEFKNTDVCREYEGKFSDIKENNYVFERGLKIAGASTGAILTTGVSTVGLLLGLARLKPAVMKGAVRAAKE